MFLLSISKLPACKIASLYGAPLLWHPLHYPPHPRLQNEPGHSLRRNLCNTSAVSSPVESESGEWRVEKLKV